MQIVGPVGCGKSAILMAMLNELLPTTGDVTVRGTLAYSPQEAWILSETVRDNILFGEMFDYKRYKKSPIGSVFVCPFYSQVGIVSACTQCVCVCVCACEGGYVHGVILVMLCVRV